LRPIVKFYKQEIFKLKNLYIGRKFVSLLKAFLIFLVTTIISYIATVPPGPLSVFVAHTTVQKNIKIALWVAIGGIICESTYAFLATEGIIFYEKYPTLAFWMQRAIIGVLFAIGIVTFFQKAEKIKAESITINNKLSSFLKGISLSLFNLALLPFWLVVLVAYQKYEILKFDSLFEKLCFTLGAGTGTFLLVLTYAFIADKKRELLFKYLKQSILNKIIGGIFIFLAMYQLWNLLV
jgi:threonine/homoserine/homoserine lactone efflux protein